MTHNLAVALLLEDEPLISLDIELMLEDAGFAVTTAVSCKAAADSLATFRPDIAIVDIVLKDEPCLVIVERLIEAGVPFIVHSGDFASMHVGTPFAHGRWINKPAAPGALAQAARALLAAPSL